MVKYLAKNHSQDLIRCLRLTYTSVAEAPVCRQKGINTGELLFKNFIL
jgi:hypothetical protein